MNQKQIGITIIIIGLLIAIFVFFAKARDDHAIKIIIQQTGSCYLEDGTCLHDRNIALYLFGVVLAVALMMLGIYLIFFDKTQKILAEHQLKVSSALKEVKEKDEFNAFLSGFTKDEQEILKAIKEQDGIKQSTLRYRTGMSKASLSLLLKSLENRDIIKRKPSGKTNEIYLRKKF